MKEISSKTRDSLGWKRAVAEMHAYWPIESNEAETSFAVVQQLVVGTFQLAQLELVQLVEKLV